jgi:AcrR family transcriptional regulator
MIATPRHNAPARAGRPRLTRRAVKKQETRERILQAAAAIARREGLPAASIPRVMREAGLTVGGFYGHFASKAAMDAEVIRTLGAVPGRAFSGLQNLSGIAWIQRAVTRYLSAAHRDNPDGCAFPAILSAIATGARTPGAGLSGEHAAHRGRVGTRARTGGHGADGRRPADRARFGGRRYQRRDAGGLPQVGAARARRVAGQTFVRPDVG